MASTKADCLSDVWKEGLFLNKVIFATGGAGTICSVQVKGLVSLGANACIVGRNVEKTERVAKEIESVRPGAKILGLGNVDVRDVKSLEAGVKQCLDTLGGLDFVIAGAAGNFLAPITQLSTNAFKSVIDIDVLGSYNTVKATLPHLIKSAEECKTDGKPASQKGTGGRIIFVSAALHYTGTPLQAHVTAAKAAVDALSNAVAIEMGPRGITSNCIAPGAIQGTEGMERLIQKSAIEEAQKLVPMGRWGYPHEIADATVYLFSNAGNHVNGHTIVVDGGEWRTSSPQRGELSYPDFLLKGVAVTGVRGGKASKL